MRAFWERFISWPDTRRSRVAVWLLLIYAPIAAIMIVLIGVWEGMPWLFAYQASIVMLAWVYCLFVLKRLREQRGDSQPSTSRPARLLERAEARLVHGMLRAAGRTDLGSALNRATVEEIQDGGMGSILFTPPQGSRSLGVQIAEATFTDLDGTLVSATLNLDKAGNLFELDVWKVDSSPLLRLPEEGDPVRIARTDT